MSTVKKLTSLGVAALVVLLFGQEAAFGQAKCINAMAKDGAKVAATKGKDIGACLKSGGGANCINTDSGKVAAAASKAGADYDKNCAADPPTFGIPGVPAGTAAVISNVAVEEEEQLAFAIFGSSAATSGDKAGAKCQTTVQKTYEKAVATYNKNFGGCVKNALKGGGTEAALQACVLNDSGGKAAAAIGKIDAGIGKACAGQVVSDLFPGKCSDLGLGLLSECVAINLRCHTCLMQNGMHGLHANCDALDDGVQNNSCAAGSACRLTNSTFFTESGVGTIPLPAVGTVGIGLGGSAAGRCNIMNIDPVNLPGVGFVCISPGSANCPTGTVDCQGGSIGGLAVGSNRNIGQCTSAANCNAQCTAFCANVGQVPLSNHPGGCEGFCTGSTPQACTLDTQCLPDNGACTGQDGVPAGNICDCTCVEYALGQPQPAGSVTCNLATNIVTELAAPCGDGDVLINVGDVCVPLTTGAASASFFRFNNVPGDNRLFVSNGTPANSCTSTTSGMGLRGGVGFYGSTLGDLNVGTSLTCR
jgi:hypothetical protein